MKDARARVPPAPSTADVARRLGVSQRTVQRHAAALASADLPANDTETWHSVGAVARRFGMPRRTLADRCLRGIIPATRTPGGHFRISEHTVRVLLGLESSAGFPRQHPRPKPRTKKPRTPRGLSAHGTRYMVEREVQGAQFVIVGALSSVGPVIVEARDASGTVVSFDRLAQRSGRASAFADEVLAAIGDAARRRDKARRDKRAELGIG